MSGIPTIIQNFSQIGLRVSFVDRVMFVPRVKRGLPFFWGGGGFSRKATAETSTPILMQNMPKDAVLCKEVPFGDRKNHYLRFRPHIPPKLLFLGHISTGLRNFCPKTALTLDSLSKNNP